MELVNEGNNLVHEVLVELVYSSGFPFMKEDTNRLSNLLLCQSFNSWSLSLNQLQVLYYEIAITFQ